MPQIKAKVTDDELRRIKAWADGVPLGPLVRRILLAYVDGPPVALPWPSQGPTGAIAPSYMHGPPVALSGPAEGPAEPGTEVALQSPQKEEKKKKGKEGALAPLDVTTDVLSLLGELGGANCRPSTAAHRRLIQARLNEGYTVDELKTVIRKKCAEWVGTKFATNLKPKCLFGASNFDGYLGQPEPGTRSKSAQTSLLNGNGQSTAPRHRLPTAEEALEAGRAAFRREQEALARREQSKLPTGGGDFDE